MKPFLLLSALSKVFTFHKLHRPVFEIQDSGSVCPVNTKWGTEKSRKGNGTETVLKK